MGWSTVGWSTVGWSPIVDWSMIDRNGVRHCDMVRHCNTVQHCDAVRHWDAVWHCNTARHCDAVRHTGESVPNFWEWKIPPAFILHPVPPLSTTIRMSWRVVSGPRWCAESACHLRLSISPLVVAPFTKTSPISGAEKFRQLLFSPLTTIFNYNQKVLEHGFWTYLMRWIRLLPPFVHSSSGCAATSENVPNFWVWKIPAAFILPPVPPLQLSLEFREGVFLDLFDALNSPVTSICP